MGKTKKKPLEELLQEMDKYDWSKVPDLRINESYEEHASEFFTYIIQKSNVVLEGSVLDICSGSVSLASIHDDVVCFDLPEEIIKELRKKGIRAVMGDISEDLPFKAKSFDYVFASGIPMLPYKRTDAPQEADFHKKYVPEKVRNDKKYIEGLIKETIRVTRKKVIIASLPVVEYLPKKHVEKIEKINEWLVVYNKNKK